MPISTNTTPSRRMVQLWRDFRLQIRNRLAKAFEYLTRIFPDGRAEQTARQELKNRELRQYEISYEARKRQLLMALRQKISDKHTKID